MGSFEILWKSMTLSPGKKAHTHTQFVPNFKGFIDPLKPIPEPHIKKLSGTRYPQIPGRNRTHRREVGCMNCNSERNFSLSYAKRVRTLDRIQCLGTSCSSSSMKDFLALGPSWPFIGPRRASLGASHHYAVCVTDLLTPQLDKPLEGRKLHLILLSPRIQHSAWHSFDKRLIKKEWINLPSYWLLHLGMI